MNVYRYELIEAGYAYETGELEAPDIDAALERAAGKCRAAERSAYAPDDGSRLEVEHAAVVTDGADTARTRVRLEVV